MEAKPFPSRLTRLFYLVAFWCSGITAILCNWVYSFYAQYLTFCLLTHTATIYGLTAYLLPLSQLAFDLGLFVYSLFSFHPLVKVVSGFFKRTLYRVLYLRLPVSKDSIISFGTPLYIRLEAIVCDSASCVLPSTMCLSRLSRLPDPPSYAEIP